MMTKVAPLERSHTPVLMCYDHAQFGRRRRREGGTFPPRGSIGEVPQVPQLHRTLEGGGANDGVGLVENG